MDIVHCVLEGNLYLINIKIGKEICAMFYALSGMGHINTLAKP